MGPTYRAKTIVAIHDYSVKLVHEQVAQAIAGADAKRRIEDGNVIFDVKHNLSLRKVRAPQSRLPGKGPVDASPRKVPQKRRQPKLSSSWTAMMQRWCKRPPAGGESHSAR